MQYKKFGKFDWESSILGFGCMRLPMITLQNGNRVVDDMEAIRMIRYAIDNGVNYIDTAYGYHNGYSEVITGKALLDGYRAKVKLATKSPVWAIHNQNDFNRLLDEQLKKLQVNNIDFYLLHALDKVRWNTTISKYKVLKSAEEALKDGRIKHFGFSFHDNYDAFEEIINGYDNWEFCQIQYNYLDIENGAGTKGLKLAASKGIPVVIMEPLLGGRLANPPQIIRDLFDDSGIKRDYYEWALRWVWNHKEVNIVLSGMSSFDQVVKNIKTASEPEITLNEKELSLFIEARRIYMGMNPIPCNKCDYCMPCPNGVNIPRNFELYNDGCIHNDMATSSIMYRIFFPEIERANNCIECRDCEEKCPQKIIISEWMPKIHDALNKQM
jgi:uncharacterized protein